MSKPFVYCDRIGLKNSKYVFISYSYEDVHKVYPILNNLYNAGVNYWYDKEVKAGDEWNEKVVDIIFDNHCVGAIIFLSLKSVLSKSVHEELKRILLKKENDKRFRIIPVIIDKTYNNWTTLLYEASKIDKIFFIERDSEYKRLFNKGYRVFLHINNDNIINQIIDIAETDNFLQHPVINIRDKRLGCIGLITTNGEYYLKLGEFKSKVNNKKEIIEWQLISQENNLFYFISQFCIDFVKVDSIASTIKSVKFPQNSKKYINSITVVTEEYINKYKAKISDAVPTDYADENRKQLLKLYWVKESNQENLDSYCLYNSVNSKIDKRINHFTITAGIRLMLIIDDDKIEEDNNG